MKPTAQLLEYSEADIKEIADGLKETISNTIEELRRAMKRLSGKMDKGQHFPPDAFQGGGIVLPQLYQIRDSSIGAADLWDHLRENPDLLARTLRAAKSLLLDLQER